MAGTQYPIVVLCWLLKELWNYWIYVDDGSMPARAGTAGGFGRLRGTCAAGSAVVGVHEAHCWVLRQHASGLGTVLKRCVSGVVFENCRVDASIFVVKLLRAHGGCLGFRSR